jgi:hypothetical protein
VLLGLLDPRKKSLQLFATASNCYTTKYRNIPEDLDFSCSSCRYKTYNYIRFKIPSFISSYNLSNDSSIASSKANNPQSAI